MKKTNVLSAILVSLLVSIGSAHAHGKAHVDADKAPNGGQVRVAGTYHVELVMLKTSKEVKDNPIMVYVTDQAGQKISTAGVTGTATVLSGKDKVLATLVPDGDNRLKGKAKYGSTPGMKVVVSITLPGKPAEQARFTPMAAAQ